MEIVKLYAFLATSGLVVLFGSALLYYWCVETQFFCTDLLSIARQGVNIGTLILLFALGTTVPALAEEYESERRGAEK